MTNQVTVTYLHHSGFMAAVEDTLLVFDYWRGEGNALPMKARITEEDFKPFKRVFVFASHSHPDHFDEVIYTWNIGKYNITYIVSDDIPVGKRGKRMAAGDTLTFDDMKVTACPSTDLGVSFYVDIDGLKIFHAGDLNLWHWRDESTLREIADAEKAFYDACEPLRDKPIDLCMFPLDPRLGGMFDAGINHFVMAVKPRLVIPMHWQERPEVAIEYARRGRTKYTEILAMTKPRERADLTFGDGELRIHMHTPTAGLYDDNEPEQSENEAFTQEDPFTDTDLPIDMK